LFLIWSTKPDGWKTDFEDYSFAYVPKGGETLFPAIINAYPVYGSSVLVFLAGGDTADDLEQQSVDVLVERAMPIAKKLMGLPDLAHPDLAYMSKWHSNPNSFGAYTFVPPGAWTGDGQGQTVIDTEALVADNINPFQDYKRSIGGKVFFAGEGTMSTRYGYVDGAFLSGVSVAKAILGGKSEFYYDEVSPDHTDDDCPCVAPKNAAVGTDIFPATWAHQMAMRNQDCLGADQAVRKSIRFRSHHRPLRQHERYLSQGMRFKSDKSRTHSPAESKQRSQLAQQLKTRYRHARRHNARARRSHAV